MPIAEPTAARDHGSHLFKWLMAFLLEHFKNEMAHNHMR